MYGCLSSCNFRKKQTGSLPATVSATVILFCIVLNLLRLTYCLYEKTASSSDRFYVCADRKQSGTDPLIEITAQATAQCNYHTDR